LEPLPRNKEFDGAFCLPWGVNVDDWWTHHVTWQLGADNATHQCFEPMTNKEKAKLFHDLYRIQFVDGNCSEVITKRMWSSGFGADIANLIDGLMNAATTGKPFQVGIDPWHYADNSVHEQQGSGIAKVACPKRNMFCYFLEVSHCRPKRGWEGVWLQSIEVDKETKEYPWYMEFMTRGQTWLRKLVSDFVRNQEQTYFTTPCTVLHVRRGDVIDHDDESRRYHAIEEYLDYAKEKQVELHKNIFLVTDDYNAIGEAQTKYPQYNWMYIDRPRQRAEDAQWEKHLASNDPTFELLVIQSIFRMVKQCDQILCSTSSFAEVMSLEMESTGKQITQLNIDQDKAYTEIHSVNNKATKNISTSY
jgi:Alpha-(1,6)-fucosyltransferase N- and catalytic domains